jgi:uncharacterized protein YggU (UPF0235/DUF167 family)
MGERIDVAVRVIPRSKSDRVDAIRAGRLVVRVAAAPESGAANRAAAALLASALGLRAADVHLEQGSTSRDKKFSIPMYARAALIKLTKRESGAGGGAAQGVAGDALGRVR